MREQTTPSPHGPHCQQPAHHSNMCMCAFGCVLFSQHTRILETYSLCTSNPQFASLFLTQKSQSQMGCFTFRILHNAAWQSVLTYTNYNILLASHREDNKTHSLAERAEFVQNDDKMRKDVKNCRNINISLVWSYCLPVVKCFWPL